MATIRKPAARTAAEPTAKPGAELADPGTGTVVRTVRVLRALAETDGPASIKDLAERIGLPPSTVHRLLDLLAGEGMVERDDAAHVYRPGLEFFRIAASVFNRMSVRTVALPFLREAADECGESAYLCLFDRRVGKMLFAATAESEHLLSYRIPLNEPQSLSTGASGLAILAWMPPDTGELDRILVTETGAAPGRAKARLTGELAQVRSQGYAYTHGKRIKGAVGIFAPVFDHHGDVIGSLGYTIPEVRFATDMIDKFADSAVRHAAALSATLGSDTNRAAS